MSTSFTVGSLVQCRGREWIVLPSDNPDLLLLRGLGSDQERCGIYLPLEPDEVKPVELPLPDPATAGDHSSAQLLRNAARLNFRSGAGPFRSLGQISVRPRPYQFVPLLMGLRLDRVRLLIADDVGVGKTIEGALIARELLDRGEVTRLAIICPPHLCDQWQQELVDKFQLPAEVIRSGTIAQLERRLPPGRSVFEHFPVFVTSIDFVKSGRYYSLFLSQCPDLVIVDEAHTCTRPPGSSAAQQQRHNLVRQLADRPERHMILLTATPHSGLEEQFRSLLGLLKPEFEAESFDLTQEDDRKELARHFVQRRRADVRHWLGADTKFPRRDASEEPYSLSADYRRLFDRVFEFAREIVKSAETLTGFRQRIRYWTALALLRCVMSSPAAAQAAFQARARRITGDESFDLDSDETAASLFDPTSQEANEDNVPTEVVDQGEATFSDSEVRRLREFSRQVAALSPASDTKFSKLTTVLEQLLAEGRHPIVYCRFIPTSNYVAERLKENSGHVWKDCRIVSITGERSEDERTEMVEELAAHPCRILVATDCLSEGINLQEHFDTVIHYDLPWNPNRLDQREGRVDRFGQRQDVVKTFLLYGKDNPMDGAVLDVLLRKARTIYTRLGVTVPVPVNSVKVMEAIGAYLFSRGRTEQLRLFEDLPEVRELQVEWDRSEEREKASRTRFAQHAIHPNEVAQEIEATDQVLGDETAVQEFVVAALQRLGASVVNKGRVWRLIPDTLKNDHGLLYEKLKPFTGQDFVFSYPIPEGARAIGRNHPVTAALADYLLDAGLDETRSRPIAARCGAIRTKAVSERTALLLLRLRYRLLEPGRPELLAEELLVSGFVLVEGPKTWLVPEDALRLLTTTTPSVNITQAERERSVAEALAAVRADKAALELLAQERAEALKTAHRRVRRITREGRIGVLPHLPPDVLGIYVLVPDPAGTRR